MIRVVAGIIKRDGKVLIARRASHKTMSGKWEFPGGKVEEGENPERALEREILEEFGVVVRTKEFLHANQHDYGDFKIELIAFSADYIDGVFKLSDHDKMEWIVPEELYSYDLTDADIPLISIL